jgi:16S rRNA (uracil1498-N3)-methyltransferase
MVTLEKALPKPPPSPVKIVLCQSLIKSRPMDYVIQKTSELGVNSIYPFYSERSVVRLENSRHLNKLKRWRQISRDAAKQSGRVAPLDIEPISPLDTLLKRWRLVDALKLMLWEEEDARDLKHLLRESPPSQLFIGIIGPEGGFTQNEVRAAREAGFMTVSLGSRILRSETAALTLVAILQYEWGDLGKSVAEATP